MKIFLSLLLLLGTWIPLNADNSISPAFALQQLIGGNQRFVNGQFQHPTSEYADRKVSITHQEPIAVVVSCSDSRVPPEILFDQGIGEIFVVRIAGNVVGPLEQDSIDYSVLYLHTPLILVLGHENCGAVKAVLDGTTKDIEDVAALIEPAVKPFRNFQGNYLENAIVSNVENVVSHLSQNKVLAPLIAQNQLQVVGAYFSLTTGEVTLLPKK